MNNGVLRTIIRIALWVLAGVAFSFLVAVVQQSVVGHKVHSVAVFRHHSKTDRCDLIVKVVEETRGVSVRGELDLCSSPQGATQYITLAAGDIPAWSKLATEDLEKVLFSAEGLAGWPLPAWHNWFVTRDAPAGLSSVAKMVWSIDYAEKEGLSVVFPGIVVNSAIFGILLWALAKLFHALFRTLLHRLRNFMKPREGHFCAKCDYNLQGNVSGVCPECGTKVV